MTIFNDKVRFFQYLWGWIQFSEIQNLNAALKNSCIFLIHQLLLYWVSCSLLRLSLFVVRLPLIFLVLPILDWNMVKSIVEWCFCVLTFCSLVSFLAYGFVDLRALCVNWFWMSCVLVVFNCFSENLINLSTKKISENSLHSLVT